MGWPPDLSRLRAQHWLGLLAAVSVAVGVVLILTLSGSTTSVARTAARHRRDSPTRPMQAKPHAVNPTAGGASTPAPAPRPKPTPSIGVGKAIGQLIVARFAGTTPTSSILTAIRAGRVGGVILFGDNTAGGTSATAALVSRLQSAARAGGNPKLLIMADQEGGLVKRFPGPPSASASQMSSPSVAAQQGAATAQLLRSAGVNVDLAPVADVSRVNGFMTRERRTFGSSPAVVARAACAFADGLSANGVAYTLKHFPGLGDAYSSTDFGPVAVGESSSALLADEAAYRQCGSGSRALVMVSSASYPNLTGSVPAVLSRATYAQLRADGSDAVTISDDFETRALATQPSPARRAIDAGLDLVLYAQSEAVAEGAYGQLYQDTRTGALSPARVRAAATKLLALKRSLGLM
jgi:beta-N-acetylhexosaminidase